MFYFFRRIPLLTPNLVKKVTSSACGATLGTGFLYTFENDQHEVKPDRPANFPRPEVFTHEFLIRQSCVLSAEQAVQISVFAITALEDSFKQLSESVNELTTLYSSSVGTGLVLTDMGHQRIVELQEEIRSSKLQISDLEIFLHYAKKLLEANSEVAFAAGAEFISIQVSERLHSVDQHLKELLNKIKAMDLDLVAIQSKFIEKFGASNEQSIENENLTETENVTPEAIIQ